MKDPANYGPSTHERVVDLESRVADLEKALVHALADEAKASGLQSNGYPKSSDEVDSAICEMWRTASEQTSGNATYPKPIEEPFTPSEVKNEGGPYSLSYNSNRVEKRVSTADELSHARGIAEIYSKACGVAIKVRDFNGNMICEYRPDQ